MRLAVLDKEKNDLNDANENYEKEMLKLQKYKTFLEDDKLKLEQNLVSLNKDIKQNFQGLISETDFKIDSMEGEILILNDQLRKKEGLIESLKNGNLNGLNRNNDQFVGNQRPRSKIVTSEKNVDPIDQEGQSEEGDDVFFEDAAEQNNNPVVGQWRGHVFEDDKFGDKTSSQKHSQFQQQEVEQQQINEYIEHGDDDENLEVTKHNLFPKSHGNLQRFRGQVTEDEDNILPLSLTLVKSEKDGCVFRFGKAAAVLGGNVDIAKVSEDGENHDGGNNVDIGEDFPVTSILRRASMRGWDAIRGMSIVFFYQIKYSKSSLILRIIFCFVNSMTNFKNPTKISKN